MRFTGVERQPARMDEEDVAHLAGVFDAVGRLTTRIHQADTPVGYRLEPVVRLRRPSSNRALLGKLDAYCREHGVAYDAAEEDDGETWVFEVTDPESVREFLDPIAPYLVTGRRATAVMLDKVVPAVVGGHPSTREEFRRVVGYADKLREETRRVGRGADPAGEPQYPRAFFEELWYDELAG